jgi:hypothetical protein
MVNTSVTYMNIIQIVLNTFGFFCFIGLFSLPEPIAKKAGMLMLFAQFSCIGCSTFALILNCYSQTINSSQRRQSDVNILLYGIYFVCSICCCGFVWYWMVTISKPVVILLLAFKSKSFIILAIVLNFAIMMMYAYTTCTTLNYVSGYPNGWGKDIEGNKMDDIEVQSIAISI